MARSPQPAAKRGAGQKPRVASRKGSAKSRSDSPRETKARVTRTAKAAPSAARQQRGGAGKAAAGRPRRNGQSQAAGWAGTLTEILNSPLSRELIADVLDAVSAVLRRERTAGQQVAAAADAISETGVDLISSAARVSNEVTAGASDTGARIAAAAMDMAEAAAGALARAGTQAVVNMLPGGSEQEKEERPRRS